MAKFSKKTYIAAATVIRATRNSYAPHWDPNLFRALDDVTKSFVQLFKADNERFDEELFKDACDYGKKVSA